MIYAVLFPFQEAQISKWCWGSCGRGGIGSLDLGPTLAVPCRSDDCPHLDRQEDEPCGDVDGEPVRVRKLKDVKP